MNILVSMDTVESYWVMRNDDGTYNISVSDKDKEVEYNNINAQFHLDSNGFVVPGFSPIDNELKV